MEIKIAENEVVIEGVSYPINKEGCGLPCCLCCGCIRYRWSVICVDEVNEGTLYHVNIRMEEDEE